MNIKETFTEEIIEYYNNNKHEITTELLEELREHGNAGKQIALDILDLKKDEEAYYLDAFGNRMSHNGDRTLKNPFTKINLSEIHIEEIEKCSKDIFYYMNNYVKIKTPKGINFVDARKYQNDFLDVLVPDENESIVSLQPRQCINKDVELKINHENQTIEELFYETKELFHKEN